MGWFYGKGLGTPSGGVSDDDKDGREAERRGCCPLLFGGGLSGNALLCGFAACHGCGAVLGCGRLCGGRLRTGFLAEKYLPWDVLLRRALFLFLTAAVCFSWEIPVFPLAFLGGVGLYHASAGILPEPVSIRNALFSAGGFLAGVFLFSPLL